MNIWVGNFINSYGLNENLFVCKTKSSAGCEQIILKRTFIATSVANLIWIVMRVFSFSAFWVGEHWKNRMMYIDWRKYINSFLEPKAVIKFYTYLSFLRHGSSNTENLVVCPWERLSLPEWTVNHWNRPLLAWAPFFIRSRQGKRYQS